MFKGELTRHLIKCYPAGRAVDKKPVPNELSMLIFYLQTRPAKIPKAARMLHSRAASYSNKDNSGNLVATILIMHEVVVKLKEHFSLFAEDALEIVDLVLDSSKGDVDLLEILRDFYSDFNRCYSGMLFAGNANFTKLYQSVIHKFVAIAQGGSPQARTLAIEALASLSESPALATNAGQKGLIIAIGGFESNLPQDPAVFQRITNTDDIDALSNSQKNPEFQSVIGLQKYLDTNSLEQITNVVRCVLDWLSNSSGDWQPQLVAFLAKWVPPQIRFVVTKAVVTSMSSLTIDNFKKLGKYSEYLDALLTAEESKIGLSVVDVLRRILRLQHRYVDTPPHKADNQAIQSILNSLRKNIGHLVNTNIYPGQAADMVAEILWKYRNTSGPPVSSIAGDNSAYFGECLASADIHSSLGCIINDFKVLSEILGNITHHSHDERKLNVSIWEHTQWILSTQHPQLLVLYASTFQQYMKFAHLTSHPSSKQGSLVTRQLCELSQQILPEINYISIYYCLVFEFELLNGSSKYFAPWVFAVLPGGTSTSLRSRSPYICQSSVGLASLLAIFRKIGAGSEAQAIFELIGERVENNLWLPGVTYPLVVSVEDAIASLVNNGPVAFNLEDVESCKSDRDSVLKLLEPHLPPSSSNILDAPYPLDSTVESSEPRATKIRADTGEPASRSFSGNSSIASGTESVAPRITDLRKKQADVQSLISRRSISMETKDSKVRLPSKRDTSAIKASELDFYSMIENVSLINSGSRGNITT